MLLRRSEIGTIVAQHVAQAEIEFEFRVQFEERQIEITTQPNLYEGL